MKHFLGHRADGGLASIETFHGGWPDCSCADPDCPGLASPQCTDERVVSLKASQMEHNPEIVGWIAVVCPCSGDGGTCSCAGKAMGANRVVDGALVAKYPVTVTLDGVEIESDVLLSRPPNSILKLKITSPAPDGTKLICRSGGNFDICEETRFELAFVGGEAPELTLVTPSQGGKGDFAFGSYFAQTFRLTLRGWSV